MVTYFNEKDLVSFGNYLLSDERKKRFQESYKQAIRSGMKNPLPPEESMKGVWHADIENWKESQREMKMKAKSQKPIKVDASAEANSAIFFNGGKTKTVEIRLLGRVSDDSKSAWSVFGKSGMNGEHKIVAEISKRGEIITATFDCEVYGVMVIKNQF